MQLTVTGRDIPLTRPIRDYVEKRLERLQRHIPRIIGVDAVLRKERQHHVVDIRLTAARLKLKVSGRSTDTMYASIDEAIAKLERSAIREKERKIQTPRQRAIRERRSRATERDRELARTPEDADDSDGIKVTRLSIKPMSVEEALLQLKTLKFSFFVFEDSQDSQVKVIYRRNDESFGLIEPDLS